MIARPLENTRCERTLQQSCPEACRASKRKLSTIRGIHWSGHTKIVLDDPLGCSSYAARRHAEFDMKTNELGLVTKKLLHMFRLYAASGLSVDMQSVDK